MKRTAQGEARPTRVAILEGDAEPRMRELDTEDDELDFMLGRLPVAWRPLEDEEDVPAGILPRHVKTTKKGRKIPTAYEGLAAGDVVAAVAGGSGANFVFALSRRAEEVGAEVMFIPPGALKDHRPQGADKANDQVLLATLVRDARELFKPVTRRDRDLIALVETWRDCDDAMKARIAAEQRLRQRLIGRAFRNKDGRYPEGALEDAYAEARASDAIVQALVKEERRLKAAVEAAVEAMPVYREFFARIEGCGPLIAARIIAGVGDIRRFDTIAGFKAYCGVHLLADNRFPKRRAGSRAPWSGLARQGFYLFAGDQCNKRPESPWGQKLLAYKAQFRAAHPVEVQDGKRTKYTKGHIHRMAVWRTATRFAEALYRAWRKIEGLAGPVQTPRKECLMPEAVVLAAVG